jgi:hypothetical protein
LKQLIIQGLIKIEEPVVQLMCRTEDKALVRGVLSDAVKEYKTLMTNAGHKVNPQVTVSDVAIPSKSWSVHFIALPRPSVSHSSFLALVVSSSLLATIALS